mmetsp:Transcript_12427/g.26298  ORF Transcript_12427/g.26298 Transcript_12427/m.26298 type:complete len:203 (-) Transcript_12427:250-858(-)
MSYCRILFIFRLDDESESTIAISTRVCFGRFQCPPMLLPTPLLEVEVEDAEGGCFLPPSSIPSSTIMPSSLCAASSLDRSEKSTSTSRALIRSDPFPTANARASCITPDGSIRKRCPPGLFDADTDVPSLVRLSLLLLIPLLPLALQPAVLLRVASTVTVAVVAASVLAQHAKRPTQLRVRTSSDTAHRAIQSAASVATPRP